MLEVVIDRTKWLRGEGSDLSYLVRPADRKMCCLGFACVAAGFTEADLLGTRTMTGVRNGHRDVPDSLAELFGEGPWENDTCETLYAKNDQVYGLSDSEREKEITSWGEKAGLEFKFIN